MFRFPILNQIKIRGPFWSADATVVKADTTGTPLPLPLASFTSFLLTRKSLAGPLEFVKDDVSPLQTVVSNLPDSTAGKTILKTAVAGLRVAEFSFPGASAWTNY